MNPAVSPSPLGTADNARRTAPNAAPTTVIVRLAPCRSRARPTVGIAVAPSSVPMR